MNSIRNPIHSLLFLGLTLILSCQVPVSTFQPRATTDLTLSFGSGSANRTLVPDLGAAIASYSVLLTSHDGAAEIAKTGVTGTSVTLVDIPSGHWDVSVTALRIDGLPVGAGKLLNQAIGTGLTTSLTVPITMAQVGQGSLSLTTRAPLSSGILNGAAQLYDQNDAPVGDVISGELIETTATEMVVRFQRNPLASGWYRLEIRMYRSALPATPVWVESEAVNVWDNLVTDQWIDALGHLTAQRTLTAADFSSGNTSLSALSFTSAGSPRPADPGFTSGTKEYNVLSVTGVSLKATGSVDGQSLRYKLASGAWTTVRSGVATSDLAFASGRTDLTIEVTAPDRVTTGTYLVHVVLPSTVSFDTQGGSAVAGVTTNTISTAPDSTKDDFFLEGWYTDTDWAPAHRAVFPFIPAADTGLHAHWLAATSGLVYTDLGTSWSVSAFATNSTTTVTATQVVIPGTHAGKAVTAIADNGFSATAGSPPWTSVAIPGSVTAIGNFAFAGKDDQSSILTSIALPKSVATIGWGAFFSNPLLAVTVDPANPNFQSLGGVLYNKAGTTLLFCPPTVSGAFTVPSGVTKVGFFAFGFCSALTSLSLPEGLTTIEDDAFVYCTGLKTLNLPASLTSLAPLYGINPFLGCKGLTTFTVAAANTSLKVQGGALISMNGATLHAIPGGTAGPFTVPDGVTTVGAYAMAEVSGLTSVSVPASVTTISASAFWRDTGLTTLTVNATTPPAFPNSALTGCTGLTAIQVPGAGAVTAYKAASDWGDYASLIVSKPVTATFDAQGGSAVEASTSNLIAGAPDSWKDDYFLEGWYTATDWTQGHKVVFPLAVPALMTLFAHWVPATANLTYNDLGLGYDVQAASGANLTGTLVIPSAHLGKPVTGIKAYGFQSQALTQVDLPPSVTSIGMFAFNGAVQLASLKLPKNLGSVGIGAFTGCLVLNLTIDPANTMFKVLDGVLYNHAGTTLVWYPSSKTGSFTVPAGVTVIYDYAFVSVQSLTSITLPEGLTTLGAYAFGLTGLTSIDLPASLTTLGVTDSANPFLFCAGLTSITVSPSNLSFKGVDGILFSKDGTVLYAVPGGKTGSYTFSSGLTTVGPYACSGPGFSSMTFPATLTTVANDGFSNSPATTLTFQSVSPPALYNKDVFYGHHLTAIHVPIGSVDAYKTAPFWSATEYNIPSLIVAP